MTGPVLADVGVYEMNTTTIPMLIWESPINREPL
jgi:hypothetical protein